MKRKFAYLLMGEQFDPQIHQLRMETETMVSCVYTVRSFDEAKQTALKLCSEGFGVLELCGAFGEERTRELIRLTGGKMGIAFVSHLPEQTPLFTEFFSTNQTNQE